MEETLHLTHLLSDSLKCPICLSFFSPPIYQCTQGHSFCGSCFEKVKDCTECQSPILGKCRNINLEHILNSIETVCKFIGCGTRVSLINKKAHESVCDYNPYMGCVFADCTWEGEGLVEHLKSKHSVKEFEMPTRGGVRGWNSKTWKNADWGYSIWKFGEIQILNKSKSDGETFYLYVYHIGNKRQSMQLSTKKDQCCISFTIQTLPVKQARIHYTCLPFNISIAVAEKYLLEPAEGLEEGYKKLAIKVKLIESSNV
jgi:E3 ubiquitin-protein ligase SIAH1